MEIKQNHKPNIGLVVFTLMFIGAFGGIGIFFIVALIHYPLAVNLLVSFLGCSGISMLLIIFYQYYLAYYQKRKRK